LSDIRQRLASIAESAITLVKVCKASGVGYCSAVNSKELKAQLVERIDIQAMLRSMCAADLGEAGDLTEAVGEKRGVLASSARGVAAHPAGLPADGGEETQLWLRQQQQSEELAGRRLGTFELVANTSSCELKMAELQRQLQVQQELAAEGGNGRRIRGLIRRRPAMLVDGDREDFNPDERSYLARRGCCWPVRLRLSADEVDNQSDDDGESSCEQFAELTADSSAVTRLLLRLLLRTLEALRWRHGWKRSMICLEAEELELANILAPLRVRQQEILAPLRESETTANRPPHLMLPIFG
uniref:Adenylate cyclase n=1 Tax=Macrostomum lignano TaxID=282301 RepID=A0A1I8F4G3_9PLAT